MNTAEAVAAGEADESGMAGDPINRALVLYTGVGASPFPRARSGALAAEFGEAEAVALKERILALYEEMQLPVPDGEKRSRKSVTERATAHLATRHPELDAEGLKALAWAYSFGLR